MIETQGVVQGTEVAQRVGRLYGVYSEVNDFDSWGARWKSVTINWFVVDRKIPPVPYETSIKSYRPNSKDPGKYRYPEGFIDECFTYQETNALTEYLKRYPGECKISEVELPIEPNLAGNGALAIGGLEGFYMLSKDENYNLPFKVWGYYDLRFATR